MADYKSFILYTEQKEVIDSLTDEQAGQLFKGIFKYVNGEDVEFDGMLKVAFIPIKQNLDRNIEKWNEVKEKRKKAGKIGAEKRWNNVTNTEITTTTRLDDIKDYYENHIGLISSQKGLIFLESFIEDFDNNDIIKKAIDIACSNDVKNINYVRTILTNWKNQGIKRVEDIPQRKPKQNTIRQQAQEFNTTPNNLDDLFDN